MSSVSFLRHAGWVSPEAFTEPVNIIGVGATGSHIALLMAKMGAHEFHIWDHDLVEAHNLPNQAYDVQHINMPKVEALKQVLQRFNPAIVVHTHQEYFEAATHAKDLRGPLVLTVDTMKARKDIYDAFKLNIDVPIVIETRLGFDYGELYVIDSLSTNQCEAWKSTLFNDEDVPEGPCNLRICTTLVNVVAGYASHALCHYFACQSEGQSWSFDFKTMINLNPCISVFKLKPSALAVTQPEAPAETTAQA